MELNNNRFMVNCSNVNRDFTADRDTDGSKNMERIDT